MFAERYGNAATSSNLINDAYHTDVDQLSAAALAGELGSQSRELGSLLFRARTIDDEEPTSHLCEKWRETVTKKASLRGWPERIKPHQVADLSLAYWLKSKCERCTGKKYEPLKDVPSVLSDNLCKACAGTGKKPLHSRYPGRDYVADMVEDLDDIYRIAGQCALRKLASDMDF